MPYRGSLDAAVAIVESARDSSLWMDDMHMDLVHRRLVIDGSPSNKLSVPALPVG